MMARGQKPKRREVACLGCGAKLLRSNYWRKPRCAACSRKAWKGLETVKNRKVREQARRYRILMHVAGYDAEHQFDEFLADLKASELCLRTRPEGRVAKIDLRLHRREMRRQTMEARCG